MYMYIGFIPTRIVELVHVHYVRDIMQILVHVEVSACGCFTVGSVAVET